MYFFKSIKLVPQITLHPWTLYVLAHYYNFGSLVVTSQKILKHRSLSTTMPNHLLSKEIASDKTRTGSKGSTSPKVRCLMENPPAASLEQPREREVKRLGRVPKEVKLERSRGVDLPLRRPALGSFSAPESGQWSGLADSRPTSTLVFESILSDSKRYGLGVH